jgi:hypothetical protein
LLALRQLSSHDLGFHLRAGNYILSGNGWPRTDPFTFTVRDHPYIDTSWGYQVALALLERASGAAALVVFHALLVLLVFALLVLTARLRSAHPPTLAGLVLLGGLAAEPRFEARPELWSYTLLALTLYLLHRYAARRDESLWPLVPLFLVWANSHSLFLLGWGALSCFVIGAWIRERRLDRRLMAWSAAAIAATLINPYGWRAPVLALSLATRMREANVFARSIGEFQSPLAQTFSDQLRFYAVPALSFWVLAALVLYSVWPLWRKRRLDCLLLCAVFLPLSLSMVRNAPLLSLACLPGVAWALPRTPFARWLPPHEAGRRLWGRALAACLIAGCALLSLRIVNDAYYVDARRLERFGLGWNRLKLPTDAASYVDRVGLRGPMMNHLNFGGYLIWALPDPVFIDGRLEVMGEAFFEQYRAALASPQGLEASVARYGLRWIVFPYRLRPDLLGGLSRDLRWRLVYVDHLAALFVRDGPGAEALVDGSVRRLSRPPDDPVVLHDLPGLGGTERPGPIWNWISGFAGRREYPRRSVALGDFHFTRGEYLQSAVQFREAILRSGGAYVEIYNDLAAALIATGQFEEAADCLRLYLSQLPFYRREARRLTRRNLERLIEPLPRGVR